MSKGDNEYKSAEMVVIGAAQEIVQGTKDFPSADDIPGWPIYYRTDYWPWE